MLRSALENIAALLRASVVGSAEDRPCLAEAKRLAAEHPFPTETFEGALDAGWTREDCALFARLGVAHGLGDRLLRQAAGESPDAEAPRARSFFRGR